MKSLILDVRPHSMYTKLVTEKLNRNEVMILVALAALTCTVSCQFWWLGNLVFIRKLIVS